MVGAKGDTSLARVIVAMCCIVIAAAVSPIANAQAPRNPRLVYDDCGIRSLAWDPVDGATNYLAERAEDSFCYGRSWHPLATVSSDQTVVIDPVASTAPAYRVTAIAAGLSMGQSEVTGADGRWSGSLLATGSPVITTICRGSMLYFSVQVLSPVPALSFDWRKNGVRTGLPNSDHVDMMPSDQDEGAVVSVVVSNGCESTTVTWPSIRFGSMPAPGVIAWTALTSSGSQSTQSHSGCYCDSHNEYSGSSWGSNCNVSDLQTDYGSFSLSGSNQIDGCPWCGPCASWSQASRSEHWSATAQLLTATEIHVSGTIFNAFGSIAIRYNGEMVMASAGPFGDFGSVDATLYFGPGTLEVSADAGYYAGTPYGSYVNAHIEFHAAPDCNQDGIPDATEIAAGAADENHNGRLDSCELAIGDLQLDGFVDGADLTVLLAHWGAKGQGIADLNGDGTTDGYDLAILLSHWGPVR